jgi:FG-GAP-like repeat
MLRETPAPRPATGRRLRLISRLSTGQSFCGWGSAAAARLAIAAALLASGCQRRDRDAAAGDPARRGAPQSTGAQQAQQGAGAGTAWTETTRLAPPLPYPLPGVRTELTAAVGKAERAAIGDLDGDGKNELVVADAQRLRVLDVAGKERASAPVLGGIQVLTIADIDGDRRAEIFAGWGMSREHRQATARVELYRLDATGLAGEAVLAPRTERNDVTAIVPIAEERGAVLIAYFDSKYTVKSVIARRGAAGAPGATWSTADVATLRMATSYARGDLDGDGRPDLAVGRIYGDDKVADGDAFVLRDGGARVPIPTTRGVRELAIADADGDGRLELFLADGWHQEYGRLARGLLTWARWSESEGGFRAEQIEDTPGQYSVGRIVPSDVDGDGRPELVTVGSSYVRMFDRRSGRWEGQTLAKAARDVAAGDLDGVPGDELVILGERVELVSLRAHVQGRAGSAAPR